MFLGFSLSLDCEWRWRQRKATSCVQYACLDSSSFSSAGVVDCESTTWLFHCKRRQMHQCRSTKAMQSALIFNARQLFNHIDDFAMRRWRLLRLIRMLVSVAMEVLPETGSIVSSRMKVFFRICHVCVIVCMPSILPPPPTTCLYSACEAPSFERVVTALSCKGDGLC